VKIFYGVFFFKETKTGRDKKFIEEFSLGYADKKGWVML